MPPFYLATNSDQQNRKGIYTYLSHEVGHNIKSISFISYCILSCPRLQLSAVTLEINNA